MLGEIFNPGDRVSIPRYSQTTRDLWGVSGCVEKVRYDTITDLSGRELERNRMVFIRFDKPTKSVGAIMTGVWVRNCIPCWERSL